MRRRWRLFALAGPTFGAACVLLAGAAAADKLPKGVSTPVRDAAVEARAPDDHPRIAPDPPALAERKQWVFDLRWERGDVYLLEVHRVDLGAVQPTPRVMGRFALELYEGPTLIERVRFDFPMLGAPEASDGGWSAPPRFEPKLKTRIGVLFPETSRGTRLELWDRARNVRWPLPWPPLPGPQGDGGPDR